MAASIIIRSGFLKSVRSVILLTNRPLHSLPKRCLHSTSLLKGKLYPTDDELYTKTSVSLLSKESKDVPYISKFSARGFTISDDIIVGPVAILPWSLVHWNVADVRDINKESLSLFHLLEPRIGRNSCHRCWLQSTQT
ncbi:NADH dehydrogenase [ubiquinone] 1 alpha subcomplex assembly factor 3 [Holothuria leucospilota]|uniref:NADH dehydrogenase [ubiquinone] 1 alpha subcomplex assembly factor 3 n=1 Tax=Holothuria leucospilota TaxID=206669 RepID=A0A9Q1HJW7_HOLLE|nr:NADH dehydrogenase [ubiquinone] 1 alpha subcomplex assembly factor 3 [Holothuria leucospilota]